MPAKDLYHEVVKTALIKDGWTITDDPFRIRLARGRNLFVDLGAERLLAADRSTERIAVEVKSFTRPSDMKDLEEALGQFVLYARLLIRHAPERTLFSWRSASATTRKLLLPGRATPCRYRRNAQKSF